LDNRFGAIVFYKYAKREMVMGLIKKRTKNQSLKKAAYF